jgi:predicted DNA-binding transcriptional regulator YafY
MAYYVEVTLLGAWCELRSDFRHFRVERIITSNTLDERFPTEGGKFRAGSDIIAGEIDMLPAKR